MDPATFFAASRVLIVAGKGGVGKTTVTATVARAASQVGLSTLVVQMDGAAGLSGLFGVEPLDYDEQTLAPADPEAGLGEVRARTITPDEALLEYLDDHGMSRVAKRLVNSGALDALATAAPGIKDILVLGKVKQLANEEATDLIVVDAPAAGHAITFLRAAPALLDSVRVGPIRNQAEEVMELLTDAARCQVMLVTLAEETPVNELIETAYKIEDHVGVALSPVVVNGLYPELPGLDRPFDDLRIPRRAHLDDATRQALVEAADFRRDRTALQDEQLARLADGLPLPQLHLPFIFTTDLDRTELDGLGRELIAGVEALDATVVGDSSGGGGP